MTPTLPPTASLSATGLKLHLGCGNGPIPGWVNCDYIETQWADRVFDVQGRWPFEDCSVQEVYASHMLEHLADPAAFFSEMWRVLQPNGSVLLRLPYGGHKAAWWDITHVRPWFAETFCFLQPGYFESIGNPQHTAWPCPYGVASLHLRLSARLAAWCRWWITRRYVVRYAEFLSNAVEEIWVNLYALKTPDAVAVYRQSHQGNVIGACLSMYRHHLTRRELRPGEPTELVPITEGCMVNGFHGWGR